MDNSSDADDMLLDVSSTQVSSQESLAGRFKDLTACRTEPHHEACNSFANTCTPVDYHSTIDVGSSRQLSKSKTKLGAASILASSITSPQVGRDNADSGTLDVIAKIESIFEGVVGALLGHQKSIKLIFSSRKVRSRTILDTSHNALLLKTNTSREIHFPGKNAQEAWRFSELQLSPGTTSSVLKVVQPFSLGYWN